MLAYPGASEPLSQCVTYVLRTFCYPCPRIGPTANRSLAVAAPQEPRAHNLPPYQLAEARIRDTLVGNEALQVAVELANVPARGLQLMFWSGPSSD